MGVVYQARQTRLDRLVALKTILVGGHAGQEELNHFRTEAEAVGRLQHPHIVPIYEVGQHNSLPFLSLEFCSGASLADKLDGTPLPPTDAARLVETLAQAVQAAHQKQIVHRDPNPANILLAASGSVRPQDHQLRPGQDRRRRRRDPHRGHPGHHPLHGAGALPRPVRRARRRVRPGDDAVRNVDPAGGVRLRQPGKG
jgi:serine/threonine protein kinase